MKRVAENAAEIGDAGGESMVARGPGRWGVILLRLAALPYVTRIIECHFE